MTSVPMTLIARRALPLVFAAGALLGCTQPAAQVAVPPVPYNPPSQTLTAMPSDARWFHVGFETGRTNIDQDGQSVMAQVADAMRSDPSLRATVIGRTDSSGSDAANMRLSQQRAIAVRDGLLRGGVAAQRIELRWTGERQTSTGMDSRAVDIALRTGEVR